MGTDRRQPLSEHSAPNPTPRLLSLRQAAAYLGVGYWSVRDWVKAERLPTVTLPSLRAREGERPRNGFRRVVIDRVDLDRWIEARKADGGSRSSEAGSS